MKKLLIISFSDLKKDPRVYRQIKFLQNKYQIITAGYGNPEIKGIDHISLNFNYKLGRKRFILSLFRKITRQYNNYYWQQELIINCIKVLSNIKVDLIIINDIDPLPLAFTIANEAKVIFDAHEYAPLEYEDNWRFKIFRQGYVTYFCKKYIPKVDSMMTVCQSIADRYEQDTSIKPIIITNAPEYSPLSVKLINEHTKKITLVHHGCAAEARKLDSLIKMMDYLNDNFELNLILVEGSKEYIKYLKQLADNKPNIKFLPPVSMPSIPTFLNQFDIGLSVIPPTNFNYKYSLPNKFFEFIQARLMLLTGPSLEMARIVKKYDCGVVAEDFSPQSLAKCLMELDYQKINYFKQQSHKIAHLMSAENNQEILLNMVSKVLEE